MTTKQIVGLVLLAVIIPLGITWLAQGNEFFLYKFFAPRQAAVERQVFENTKQYKQGMIQDLQDKRAVYVTATKEQQAALADIILHEAADFPKDQMPPDLRQFIEGLEADRYKTHY